MVEITYQMVLSTLQTLSLMIGVIYYITIMRNSQKTRELTLESQEQALETRQAQMFMQIYIESHNDPSFIEAIQRIFELEIHTYEELLKVWENEKDKQATARVAWFFEGVGVLVKEGYVDIKLVALLMTGMIRGWWERIYKSWIEEGREKTTKRWMSEAEYLYDELMKYLEEHPELKT
jgi:hypothetical protein